MFRIKILLSIGLFSLLLFGLSAGTIALFTSEAVSRDNRITVGCLFIGGEHGCRGMLDLFVSLDNLVPGEEPEKRNLKVKNLGTMPAYLNGLSANLTGENDKFIANAIKTVCRDLQGNTLFEGSLLALDGSVVPLEREVAVDPGEVAQLDFSFQLDERVSNWYKEKQLGISFTVYAGQQPRQVVGETVHLAEVNSVQDALDQAGPGDVVLIPPGSYQHLTVKPGIKVKAKGLVFDTEVDGFTVEIARSKDINDVKEVSSIQGFTINGLTRGYGVSAASGQICEITDCIFDARFSETKHQAVVVGKGVKALVTRNDLSSSSSSFNSSNIDAAYNLGVDLDPDENAL